MLHLTRIFSIGSLVILSFFAISCDDDDKVCSTQYLTKFSASGIVDEFYYNDDGTLATMIQTVDNNRPRREEYFYDGNQRLVRIELIEFWDYEFFYDEDGRVEVIEMNDDDRGDLLREIKYYYGSDGRLTKREIFEDEVVIYKTLYEYPAENIVDVTVLSLEDDETWSESRVVHTLDDKRTPYPIQYTMGWDALGGISTEHNVIKYEVFKDGVLVPSQSYSYNFVYNEAGYPTGYEGIPEIYTYSCDPVKEP